jgi:hypothetical protein
MSSDSLTYAQSSSSEGTAQIFVRKDWCNPIVDQQNGSYRGLQSIIDTSIISNSGLYASYRDGYLAVPMVATLTGTAVNAPATAASSLDYSLGLKSWYGQLIHSIQVEVSGTTVCQNTSFANIWNYFRLITSLSWQDVKTQGASIGFYPDNALSIAFASAASTNGTGTCNNINAGGFPVVTGADNSYDSFNEGFLRRQQYINYDAQGLTAPANAAYSTLLTNQSCAQLYKNYINSKVNGAVAGTNPSAIQYSITGILYLKHLHKFFEQVPLMKGVFMRLTLWLNQPQTTINVATGKLMSVTNNNNPTGGTNPLMIASAAASNGSASLFATDSTMIASLFVGNRCENTTQTAVAPATTSMASSVTLNIPLFTFSPVFEDAYLSSRVKKVVYEDIYQFKMSAAAGATFNQLITNGISGIQSVLVVPYFTAAANGGDIPIQSVFDSASGTTSPLCLLTNFNVSISGQNAFQRNAMYSYENFLKNLYGVNAINGGLTDGLTSGLIGQLDFEMGYCYHYANVSRMLPEEVQVPKSVTVMGTNLSAKDIDMFVFVSYRREIAFDIMTGLRIDA